MAAGLPGDVDLAAGVTLRLYESSGAPAQARVRLHGGLHTPTLTSVLEESTGSVPPAVDGDDLIVGLAAADVVTLAAVPSRITATGVEPAPATEAAQPVFTRYWMHNKGPAPLGNLPVTVHLHPTTVDLPATVRVTVASATQAAAGFVELDVPPGLHVTPDGPYRYDLAAGDHRSFELTVTAPDAAPGRYFLAAQIRDALGQVLEDAVQVTVGPALAAVAASEPPADLSAALEPAEVAVSPGGSAQVTLRLTNRSAAPLRGEAQLLSPFGTWGEPGDDIAVTPWTQAFTVPASATSDLTFTVTAPPGARTGGRWWALARITCFGTVAYTAPVSLVCHS